MFSQESNNSYFKEKKATAACTLRILIKIFLFLEIIISNNLQQKPFFSRDNYDDYEFQRTKKKKKSDPNEWIFSSGKVRYLKEIFAVVA